MSLIRVCLYYDFNNSGWVALYASIFIIGRVHVREKITGLAYLDIPPSPAIMTSVC